MNITDSNNSFSIINFTDFEYIVLRCLIFFEFLWTLLNFFIIFTTIYLFVKVPQFHRNVNGIVCNIGFAADMIFFARFIQIITSQFEPLNPIEMSHVFMEIRLIALNTYFFMILTICIERTLATILLKTYEDFKSRSFLAIAILIPWVCGAGFDRLETYGILSTVIGNIVVIIIISFSASWLLVLHFYNVYRYNRRMEREYTLRERFQLTENIKFLKMTKWVTATIVLGNIGPTLLFVFWLEDARNSYSSGVVLNFLMLFNGTAIPIAASWTNLIWRRELIRMIKKARAKIVPWLPNEQIEENRRFNAPYLRTLAGKPMVFGQLQEQDLYFQHLRAQL